MGRQLVVAAIVAFVAVLGSAGVASAVPTKKVQIETEPPGAKVYLNAKEDGAVCEATPCTIDAPFGDTPIIVELAGYAPLLDSLSVPRNNKPQKVRFELEATGGIADISYEGDDQAQIKIDNQAKGKTPQQISLDAGIHRVVITANGKTLYDKPVEIELGKTFTIVAKAPDEPPGPPPTDPTDPPGDGSNTVVVTPLDKTTPDRIVRVSAVFDVGFRHFSYSGAKANSLGQFNVGDDTEAGQLMGGPLIEVWPTQALKLGVLPKLELVARLEFGFHDQTVSGPDIMDTTTTFWQSYEFVARNRFSFADDSIAVDASIGYERDRFEFNGGDHDISFVPDADYQSVELGVRGALPRGTFEPYIDLQSRIVVSGGQLQDRFAQASATGLHAALGVSAHRGNLTGRLEAQLTRYSWTFSNGAMENPTYVADGGTDQIELISFVVGYSY